MRAHLLRLAGNLRESYWFVPSLMALSAMVLALLMVFVDSSYGSTWMDDLAWLHAARPDGARGMLSAIGGSMLGVAGTTFSVTIAAVVYASGQYGPRLLSNFMADRGNQVTLGTFIATFVYSMVVLRTIRSPGENGGASAAFVPQLALFVALVLVFCSIAVLIYFIHHVPQRIHINSVIEEVGRRLLEEIENRFPVFVGEPLDADESDDPSIPIPLRSSSGAAVDRRVAIRAHEIGYIQVLDDTTLMDVAKERGLVVRLQYQPGDFAHRGSILAEAWPPEQCDEEAAAALRRAFAFGSRRSPLQDLRLSIDELVEIGARALSPGVNDPFTANSCLDWLGAALADLARRELPSSLRADDEGKLRIIARPTTFALLVERSFGALAQYASTDLIAGRQFLKAIGDVSLSCESAARLEIMKEQVRNFRSLAEHGLVGSNRDSLCQRIEMLLQALDDPAYKRHLSETEAWFGGSA